MNIKRNIVLIIFFIFTLFIFLNWHDYTNSANMPVGTTASNLTSKIDLELQNPQSGVLVNIKTNTLDLTINNHGNIINSYLLHYTDLKSKNIFKLLTSEAGNSYIAQVGLTGPNGIDYVKNGQDVSPVYTVQKPMYTISNGQKELDVPLTYKDGNVTYIKTYIVKPDSYTVTVKYSIENNSAKPLNLIPYAQLLHTDTAKGGLFSRSEVKAAYSSSSSNFNKYSFEEIKKSNLNVGTNSGWVGMLQHYFTVALIPGKTVGNGISKDSNQDLTSFNSNYTLYTKYNNALNLATIGYISKQITVNPNSQATASMTMWIGPNLPSTMATVAPHLNLAVNYGYLWFISKPLFVILKFIHSFIGNWGFSIIILTLLVRLVLYPLTKAQYTSMAKMRMLQPRLKELKERYGNDRQAISKKTMEIYKEQKVNPLGGCFPVVLQMPFFLGLYWMFMATAQLRQAPFILWIHNLAAPDPYYILPILMGVSMYFLQKMTPTGGMGDNDMQQKIMQFTPVIFVFFFLNFASGLVLYWLTSNVVSIVQQQIIYKNLEKKGLYVRDSKKSKKGKK